jgi:hypothetical protein
MKKLIIQIVLVLAVIFLSYKVYDSIMEPVRYKKATGMHEKAIIQKLLQIKELQLEFEKINNRYTGSFDTLAAFFNDGKIPMILKSGVVPDTLSEEIALKMGLITRDTTYISVKDSLFKDDKNFDISKLSYVPFTHGKVKFEMEASTVVRANFKVPVFEVRCFKRDYLAEIKEQDLLQNDLNIMEDNDKFPGLKLGSLTEPSTDGNW